MTIEEAIQIAKLDVKESNQDEFIRTWRRLSNLLLDRGDSKEKIINKILNIT